MEWKLFCETDSHFVYNLPLIGSAIVRWVLYVGTESSDSSDSSDKIWYENDKKMLQLEVEVIIRILSGFVHFIFILYCNL